MTTLPLAEARANLSKLVDSAVRTRERITVTRNGQPAAVILSAADLEALTETLDILSDTEAVRELALAQEDFARGEYVTLARAAEGLRRPDER
ncbi:MAG: type II toxin-antitoxin system Phd/YefM family antitoxin [Bifidobacteriaceae bacterium]|jgi:prevent-host-death family protein|nr:type II toxin-antitoxin system Phd/YefM family antitoxin [Bifidobacteriaceae bacterium]